MSVEMFERQISWLEQNFDIVSLEEAQRRIVSGHNTRPTVCITFDDGYADNSLHALPYLIKRKIPFSYFLCLENLHGGKPFEHDVLHGAPLAPHDIESVRILAAIPTVEIGAHTRTHADVGTITDADKLIDELVKSTLELQTLIGKPVRYFAFPFGQKTNLTTDAFHLLKAIGIKGVCSAYGGLNEIGGDAFHIQRLHADPNFDRIVNWLTLDPRISRTERFEYQSAKVPTGLIERAKQMAPLEDPATTSHPIPVPASEEQSPATMVDIDVPKLNVIFPPAEST